MDARAEQWGERENKLETVLQEDYKMENGQVHVNFRVPL